MNTAFNVSTDAQVGIEIDSHHGLNILTWLSVEVSMYTEKIFKCWSTNNTYTQETLFLSHPEIEIIYGNIDNYSLIGTTYSVDTS